MTDPKELRALLAKISDGPWAKDTDNDAALLAAARSAVPALLDRVDELEGTVEAERRQKRAYLDEIDRQKAKIAEQRGVLEWIANHRNDHLTDGSPATRACLDEIVNLAASLLTPSDRSAT